MQPKDFIYLGLAILIVLFIILSVRKLSKLKETHSLTHNEIADDLHQSWLTLEDARIKSMLLNDKCITDIETCQKIIKELIIYHQAKDISPHPEVQEQLKQKLTWAFEERHPQDDKYYGSKPQSYLFHDLTNNPFPEDPNIKKPDYKDKYLKTNWEQRTPQEDRTKDWNQEPKDVFKTKSYKQGD